MKNLKIIVLVIAAHVTGLAVLLSVQGCRSTTAPTDKNSVAQGAGRSDVALPDAAMVAHDATDSPVVRAAVAAPLFQPIAVNVPGATATAPAMPPADRFAPTRPGTPAAAETLPAQNYVVKKNDTLGAIAKRHNITKEELSRANNLNARSATLQIGQKLIIPSPKAAGSAAAGANGGAVSGGPTYKVRSGDTLGAIARRHGVTLAALRSANGLSNDAIGVGQELKIPGGAAPAASSGAAPDAPSTLNPLAPSSSSTGTAKTQSTPPASGAKRGNGRHVVSLGENIGAIAARYRVSQVDIMSANNITNAKSIRPGQELIIPGAAGVAAPPQPAIESSAPLPSSNDSAPVVPAGDSDIPVQKIDEAPPVVPAH